MRLFTEKAFSEFTKPMTKQYRQTFAWLSASFGRGIMYWETIERHPEEYFDWAKKSAADRVIGTFKTICKHDMACAKILYETYCHDLWNMVRKSYNCDNPVDYFEFYYKEELG